MDGFVGGSSVSVPTPHSHDVSFGVPLALGFILLTPPVFPGSPSFHRVSGAAVGVALFVVLMLKR